MKLKFFLFFLIVLGQQGIFAANEKPIKVNISKWFQHRSMLTVPNISHIDNTIYIYSDQFYESLEVTITDIAGNIVYANYLTVNARENISLSFEITEESEYLIEIRHGNKFLYGWFELE